MAKYKTEYSDKKYGDAAAFLKGLIVSFIITFACVILFAFIIKWTDLSNSYISPINLGIKALSVGIGTLIFSRKSTRGIIKGFVFASFYTAVAFVLFSLLAGNFNFGVGLILDMLFTGIVGSIFGIIGVNTKK